MCINWERRLPSGFPPKVAPVKGEGAAEMAFDWKLKAELEQRFGEFIRMDEPMFRHTSFSIGGPADVFAAPGSVDQLISFVAWVRKEGLPITILGHGSNLLVKDKGIRGVVMTLKGLPSEITLEQETDCQQLLAVSAGRPLHSVLSFAIDQALKGLNFATGIPGSVGGGISMNAGTHSGSMGDVVESIRILSPEGHMVRIFRKSLSFSYRKCDIRDDFGNPVSDAIILDAMLRLERGEKNRLQQERDAILSSRKKSQPMNLKSAGCFFKNPASGKSAGELIDLSGLKGANVGGARVSERHANYFINEGKATAADMIGLRDLVRERVLNRFGVYLEEEVRIIGE